jgi:hypothetical protein
MWHWYFNAATQTAGSSDNITFALVAAVILRSMLLT